MTEIQQPPKAVRKMTLIYIKDQYGNKFTAIALVEDEKTANAVTSLIERSGAKANCVDVPIWPDIKAEED